MGTQLELVFPVVREEVLKVKRFKRGKKSFHKKFKKKAYKRVRVRNSRGGIQM